MTAPQPLTLPAAKPDFLGKRLSEGTEVSWLLF